MRRNYSSNGLQNPPETEIIPVLDKPAIPILHYLFIYFCKEGTTENYLTIGNKTNNLIDFFIKKILGNLSTHIKTLILESKLFFSFFNKWEDQNFIAYFQRKLCHGEEFVLRNKNASSKLKSQHCTMFS